MEIPGYVIGERITESDVVALYHATRVADDEPVVIKTITATYPRREHVAELRREYHLTERLGSITGVVGVQSLETFGHGNVAMVMEPFDRSLADVLRAGGGQPLPLERFLSIAIQLVRTLGELHELDVVHKNVVPASIAIVADTDEIRLIEFGIASELSSERQGATLSQRLEGSFPYLSPEQTGRMNRSVDYRSDFYSLGVTLFELLTGQLPFMAEHALEWVHCHICTPPPSANDINGDVPKPLADIVVKLMAKNAEDRYQSAFGLIADLQRCQAQLTETGMIVAFPLGQRDISRRFQLPQRLFGRETELSELLGVFELVAAGSVELCLVAGDSGVGKTALVNEIGEALVREKGYLVQGKFDQFQSNTAYAAFAVAFRSLVSQLLAESSARLDVWREALLEALGANGRLIVEIAPDLERIIGAQPSVPDLPPTEALNRLQIVVTRFVRVFASVDHPLVIFLDDLQWSDAPTLELIQQLLSSREMSHLMLIGAYRSGAVDLGHPLHLALNAIRAVRDVPEVAVQPLGQAAVRSLVAETLDCDDQHSGPLADLLHDTAQGNPFFIVELLRNLHDDGFITFDPDSGSWVWDVDHVRRAGISDNVAEYMVASLRKLPSATQQVMQLAACIGNVFDLQTLSVIAERSMDGAADDLLVALRRTMIVPLDDDYRLVGQGAADAPMEAQRGAALNPLYAFHHDRVQQAAYELIDDDRKQAMHLRIGRLMEQHAASGDEFDDRLIDIVGHLNQGRNLISNTTDRVALAELNLHAGTRAKRSSAYQSALTYLEIALELLPDDPWNGNYDLTMALTSEYQQCAYLVSRYDEADEQIELMLKQARTDLEQAEILSVRTRQSATLGRMEESIRAAIAGLSLLGIEFPENPTKDDIDVEVRQVRENLGGRAIEDLINAPRLTDERELVAIRLLMEIFPASFLSGSGDLFPFLVLKSVNLSLRHGNSPETAFAYATYGMLLCGALEDPALGYRYGKLAVAMNEMFDDIAFKSRVIYVYAMFIHHWSDHWSTMTPWFRKGIEAGYQSGDLLYLAYSAQDCVIWDPRLDLETASRQHREYLAIVRECEYRDSLDSGMLFLQMQLNFLGLTDGPDSLSDDSFDEDACVAGMLQRKFMTGVANFHIYKTEVCFLHGDFAQARQHVREQDGLVASAMSLPQLVRYRLVAFLTLAACYGEMTFDERIVADRRFDDDLRQMSLWATNCPANFLHLQLLMEAERLRLEGKIDEAMARYDEAIGAAHDSAFLRDEAMSNERAGRCLLTAGRSTASEGYLRAAHHLFDRWGARRKVALMEAEFADLVVETGGSRGVERAALDMESVIRASQAISGELFVDQLWSTTLPLLLQNAGGQRGCLVVRRDGQLVVEAQATLGGIDETRLPFAGVRATGDVTLPLSVIDSVLRTNEPVVLNDPTQLGRFGRDAYFAIARPQSVICIPMSRHGRFEGAIYMENNLARGVFIADRVEVVRLLAAQAMISLENAGLYQDQVRLTEAQSRFVPRQFLESLERRDIAHVGLGEHVAKEMSVLFADLRGFTPLAERMHPKDVVELLNRYFVSLEPPIAAAGGFIDSFSGDNILALFDGRADSAVQAGVGMSRALDQFNELSRASGDPELRFGIGINTGPLLLGTVGTHDRIQCTVVGDTVNAASRIEQLTKSYDARLLIGQQTFDRLGQLDQFSLRAIDRVSVKGKTQAFDVYEVLDAELPARRAAKELTRDLLSEVIRTYRDRAFFDARALARQALEHDPDDAVLALYVERCQRFLQHPPGPEWQAVDVL